MRWVRWTLGGLLAVGLLWVLAATVLLVDSINDARSSRAALEGLRADVEIEDLREPTAVLHRLDSALRGFERARNRARSPVVAPLRILPVVGRQVHTYGVLNGASAAAIEIGIDAIEGAERVLGGRWGDDGRARVQAMERLHTISESARQAIADLDAGSGNALMGPLAEWWGAFHLHRNEVLATLGRTSDIAAGLASFYAGPSRYLLLVANNAEMRSGSGMYLFAGELHAENGRLAIERVEPIWEHNPPEGAVAVSGDLADRWGWLSPGDEFRNLALSPQFPSTGELAAAMWSASQDTEVDGVLAVDAVALAGILAVTGPVEVDGQTFSADDVVPYLLNGQYHEIDPDAYDETQEARRDRLGVLAREVVAALQSDLDPVALALELRDAGKRRHVLAWSHRPIHQRMWEAAGVDGALGPESLLVAVINRGGNKLDYFLRIEAEVEIEPGADHTEVAVHVQLRNVVDPDQPRYVAGPHPSLIAERGEYYGILAVSLPAEARNGRFDGVDALVVAGPDGSSRVVGAPVRLPRRHRATMTLRFELPAHVRSIELEPTARVPPIRWRRDGQSWLEGETSVVRW